MLCYVMLCRTIVYREKVYQQTKTTSHCVWLFKQVLSSSWDGWPFGHNGHGPKEQGAAVPLALREELGPRLTQCGLGRGLPHTKRHLDPSSRLAAIDIGRKLDGGCALWGGTGSPSNTMSPEPRSTSLPIGILIHPTVWPQQTWAENGGLCPFVGRWVPI